MEGRQCLASHGIGSSVEEHFDLGVNMINAARSASVRGSLFPRNLVSDRTERASSAIFCSAMTSDRSYQGRERVQGRSSAPSSLINDLSRIFASQPVKIESTV
jgi:hypothetical protein